jgi:hypothetical protein
MTDSINIDIHGLAETQRAIYRFSEALGDRVTLLALRSGANYMLKKVRQAAPKKTGRLRRAIVVQTSKINKRHRNGKVGVYLTIKKGHTRNDPKGAIYGQWVERGYKHGPTQVAGKNFIAGTFESNKQNALDLIITNIDQGGRLLLQEIDNR